MSAPEYNVTGQDYGDRRHFRYAGPPIIDIHAHVVPRSLWNAVDTKQDWYGYCHAPGPGMGFIEDGRGRKTTLPP